MTKVSYKGSVGIFKDIKLDPAFLGIRTGGGKNSPGPLQERIGFVEKKLQQAI